MGEPSFWISFAICTAHHDLGGIMPTRLNPYIAFDGNAREAMEFYRDVFGG